MNNERFYNIDFLKIVGCVAIVLYHFCSCVFSPYHIADNSFYSALAYSFNNAYFAVDLFFIISGLLFAIKTNFQDTLWNFLKHKIIRLYPPLIVAMCISLFFTLFGVVHFDIYKALLVFVGLSGTSTADMGSYSTIHVFWYVSSMLWAFVLYFFLIKNLDRKWANFYIILIIYVSYSLLVHNSWSQWIFNMISSNSLRAFGGVGVGYLLGCLYLENKEKISSSASNLFRNLFLSILEGLCIYFIINTLFFNKVPFHNKIVYIVVFAITVILFMWKQGLFSKILNRKLFGWLVKFTYPIFIVHGLIIEILNHTLWRHYKLYLNKFPEASFLISVFIIILSGLFVYIASNLMTKKIIKQ